MQNMKMIGWLGMGAVAGVLMAWGGSTTGWTKPYDPAVMAYWVQAIGSIGAVCAAIAVSALQRKNDRIRERERDYAARMQTLDGIVAILDEAYRVVDEAPKKGWSEQKIDDYFQDGRYYSEFLHVYQALDRMPLHTIPWWQISCSAMELQTAVRECQKSVTSLASEFAQRHNLNANHNWRRFLGLIEESWNLASAAIEVVRSMEQAIRPKPSLPGMRD
ncbi:hypothetical protein [Burkholderia cepacia]|uniref:hypothetical protein n=1 Tax=Burkholderia cepacia TaxID=292 RepID=UPI000A4A733C|nr:hypothetical protein [Burkholderia cepacia]